MTIIHANDPTTKFLSVIYNQREDIRRHITEKDTTSDVKRAIRDDKTIMMLGHGDEYGLYSAPDKKGKVRRRLIKSDFVYLLRDTTCIAIWCKANEFAHSYDLHGLFSGMIISELEEALLFEIPTTLEELHRENEKFAQRLKFCFEKYNLKEVPARMKELDDENPHLPRSIITIFFISNRLFHERFW